MRHLIYCIVFLFFAACAEKAPETPKNPDTSAKSANKTAFGIVIHGGAGTILKKNMTDSMETAYTQKLEEAIRLGHAALEKGGTAMEAVTKTTARYRRKSLIQRRLKKRQRVKQVPYIRRFLPRPSQEGVLR